MKGKVFRIILWTSFFLLLALVIYFQQNEGFHSIRPVEADSGYLLHEKEQIPREKIDLFLVNQGKIYLFYEDSELLNVYADSGEFLYGFQFPDAQNGRSDIAWEEGILYVHERGSGYYAFQGRDLIRFERGSIYNEERKELQTFFKGEYSHTDGVYTYTYLEKENKLVRGTGETEEVFLEFPKRNPAAAGALLLAALMVVLLSWLNRSAEDSASNHGTVRVRK